MTANTYLSIEPSKKYLSTDSCAVCRTALSDHVHRLGRATIHTGGGGSKHPMHRECFYQAIKNSGQCPICRIAIPVKAFSEIKMSLARRITGLSLIFAGTATYHFLMSYLTKSPKLSAALPGIVNTGFTLRKLYYEHTDLGLETSLKHAIINDLALGAITIVIPLFAAAIAERATDSPIKNSLITTTISILGLITFLKVFVGKKKQNTG